MYSAPGFCISFHDVHELAQSPPTCWNGARIFSCKLFSYKHLGIWITHCSFRLEVGEGGLCQKVR